MKLHHNHTVVAALALAAFVSLPQPGQAAEKLILGVQTASNGPFDMGARYFADKVKERTNGEIEVEVYPDAALGTEAEMFEGIQQGTIDAMVTAPGTISGFVPAYQILDIPFLFRDLKHRDAVVNGPVGERLEKLLKDKGNVVVLGNFGGSTRNIISRGPRIGSLDDLAGVNMRVWEAPVIIDTWKAVGANPIVVAYAEVYTALQTGVIDIAENEWPTFVEQKWYEPSKSISMTEHSFVVRPLIISAKKFQSLSPEYQEILRQAGKEAAAYEVKLEVDLGQTNFDMLHDKHGIEIVQVSDREKWIEKTEPVREKIAGDLGISDLLKDIYAVGE